MLRDVHAPNTLGQNPLERDALFPGVRSAAHRCDENVPFAPLAGILLLTACVVFFFGVQLLVGGLVCMGMGEGSG